MQQSKHGTGRRKILAGTLVILFVPAISTWKSIELVRPHAESIMRGSGGSHGMPGCSPPVAWTLGYMHKAPLALLVLAGASVMLGLALVVSGLLDWRTQTRR
jgi:hypothetical protein